VIESKTANLDFKYFFRLFNTCALTFYFNLMRILFYRLLCLLLLGNVVNAQKIQWEKSYGGKHDDYLMDLKPTPDYGFILVGSSLSKKSGNKSQDNNGDLDYWIWKMKENGDLDWQKNIGGSGSDFLQSIALTNDAGYILAGTSNSEKGFDKEDTSKGQDDFWIIKLNAKGEQEWQKTIGGSGQERLQSIQQTRDGGYIIGGSSSSEPTSKPELAKNGEKTSATYGNLDYWVVKIDHKGTIEWEQTYGGVYADELRSMEQTFDGGYILGGYSNSPISGNKADDNKGIGDYWVVKIDKKGTIEWQKTIGGDKDDQLYVVHQTYDKGYILGGNSNSGSSEDKRSDNSNGTDFWVLKLDQSGKQVWQETYDFGKFDILTSLVENVDHTILLGGFAQGEIAKGKQKAKKGTDDFIALKIDEKGTILWDKIVGSDGKDVLKKVIETRDGGYLMAGTSNPFPSTLANNQSGAKGLLGNGNNQQLDNAKNELNSTIKEQGTAINKSINETTADITNTTKETLGLTDNSPLKIGSGTDALSGGLLNGIGGGDNSSSTPQKKLPSSRDKNTSYGNFDFWVVKLKDDSKPEKEKLKIEVSPNPTMAYTNIVIGYDYESGTATVVDLAGHVIQKIEITSRTVPIDLSKAPEGIYIVNINTNVQNDGVKIIKAISKN
jgi:hypothetical protein